MSLFENESSFFQSGLKLAYRYLSYRPRTILEMKNHLRKKDLEEKVCNQVISHLVERKYLDDQQYAAIFVENRIRNHPESLYALNFAMKNKGIAADIRYQALEQLDNTELAGKALEKKFYLWLDFDDEKFKKKSMSHLRYRGFDFETCQGITREFLSKKRKAQRSE